MIAPPPRSSMPGIAAAARRATAVTFTREQVAQLGDVASGETAHGPDASVIDQKGDRRVRLKTIFDPLDLIRVGQVSFQDVDFDAVLPRKPFS